MSFSEQPPAVQKIQMLGALSTVVHPKVHLQATATSLLVYIGSVEMLYVFNFFDPQQIIVGNTGAMNNEVDDDEVNDEDDEVDDDDDNGDNDKNDANGGSEWMSDETEVSAKVEVIRHFAKTLQSLFYVQVNICKDYGIYLRISWIEF